MRVRENVTAPNRERVVLGSGKPCWRLHTVPPKTKNTCLAAQYYRLTACRGKQRALVAVAHTILVIACHLLRTRQTYRDLGPNYFDWRDREAVRKRLVNRLQ